MGLELIDTGNGKLAYAFYAVVHFDRAEIDDLTDEQRARLEHHLPISSKVFTASGHSMLKGVLKYGPEPMTRAQAPYWHDVPEQKRLHEFWFPHLFSEAVDCANQAGLFADALGVEL